MREQEINLLADARRQRFLDELAEHAEDAGDHQVLGAAATYTKAFNLYAMQKRSTQRYILALVALTTFLFPFLAILIAQSNVDTLDVWWQGFIVFPAILMLLPLSPGTIVLALLPDTLQNFVLSSVIIITPLAACIFWTILCYAYFRYQRHAPHATN
jgi:hypothetical protein